MIATSATRTLHGMIDNVHLNPVRKGSSNSPRNGSCRVPRGLIEGAFLYDLHFDVIPWNWLKDVW